jgi:hypothetical protein
VIPFQDRARPRAPAAEAAPRRSSALRAARWAVPLVAAALAGVLVVPRLTGSARSPGAATAPARETSVVSFEVVPRASQLFLDGAPLSSNPVTLGRGEVHTVTAAAPGYDVAVEKFFVDSPTKTVRLQLARRRSR